MSREKDGWPELIHRLAAGLRHVTHCTDCCDGDIADCMDGGLEAKRALEEYDAMLSERSKGADKNAR